MNSSLSHFKLKISPILCPALLGVIYQCLPVEGPGHVFSNFHFWGYLSMPPSGWGALSQCPIVAGGYLLNVPHSMGGIYGVMGVTDK